MHLFLKCQNNNSKVIACLCKGLSGCSKTIQLGLIFRQLRNLTKKHTHYLSCAHTQFREKARKKKQKMSDRQITIYGIGIELLAGIIEVCGAIMTISLNIPPGSLSITLFQTYLDSFSHSLLSSHQCIVWFLLPVYQFIFL